MKKDFFVFCLAVLVLFFFAGGYSSFTLAAIYFVIFFVGAVFWIIARVEASTPGKLKKLVSCPACKECLPVTPTNRAPEYINGREVSRDDMKSFVKTHSRHNFPYCGVAFLTILLGPWRKRWVLVYDPMIRNELFLANGSKGLFLIHRGREDILQPLSYRALSLWRPKTFIWLTKWIFA